MRNRSFGYISTQNIRNQSLKNKFKKITEIMTESQIS